MAFDKTLKTTTGHTSAAKHWVNGRGYNEELLEKGKYREWFWSGLSELAVNWASGNTAFERVTMYHKCVRCGQRKAAGSFNLSSNIQKTCNKCFLNTKGNVGDKRMARWEDPNPYNWQKDAACAGVDSELFFPNDITEYRDPGAVWRQLCPGCPVSEMCDKLADAHTPRLPGIYAGKWTNTKGLTYIDHEVPAGRQYPYRCRGKKYGSHLIEGPTDHYASGDCKYCDRARTAAADARKKEKDDRTVFA